MAKGAKEPIIMGSDHAGLAFKERLKKLLIIKGHEIIDLGTHSSKPVDYPDIAKKVAKRVKAKKNAKGILVCGSGTGMCMAANKFRGIRAVAAYDAYTARMSRLDNDSNMLCLRGRGFSPKKAENITSIWLSTKFSKKKRHIRRIRKLDRL